MCTRATRGYHHAVDTLLVDGVDDSFLCVSGAGIKILFCVYDVGQSAGVFGQGGYVNHACNI